MKVSRVFVLLKLEEARHRFAQCSIASVNSDCFVSIQQCRASSLRSIARMSRLMHIEKYAVLREHVFYLRPRAARVCRCRIDDDERASTTMHVRHTLSQ